MLKIFSKDCPKKYAANYASVYDNDSLTAIL